MNKKTSNNKLLLRYVLEWITVERSFFCLLLPLWDRWFCSHIVQQSWWCVECTFSTSSTEHTMMDVGCSLSFPFGRDKILLCTAQRKRIVRHAYYRSMWIWLKLQTKWRAFLLCISVENKRIASFFLFSTPKFYQVFFYFFFVFVLFSVILFRCYVLITNSKRFPIQFHFSVLTHRQPHITFRTNYMYNSDVLCVCVCLCACVCLWKKRT